MAGSKSAGGDCGNRSEGSSQPSHSRCEYSRTDEPSGHHQCWGDGSKEPAGYDGTWASGAHFRADAIGCCQAGGPDAAGCCSGNQQARNHATGCWCTHGSCRQAGHAPGDYQPQSSCPGGQTGSASPGHRRQYRRPGQQAGCDAGRITDRCTSGEAGHGCPDGRRRAWGRRSCFGKQASVRCQPKQHHRTGGQASGSGPHSLADCARRATRHRAGCPNGSRSSQACRGSWLDAGHPRRFGGPCSFSQRTCRSRRSGASGKEPRTASQLAWKLSAGSKASAESRCSKLTTVR